MIDAVNITSRVHWTYLQPPLGWSGHGHLPSHIPEVVSIEMTDFTEDVLWFTRDVAIDGKKPTIDISWFNDPDGHFYCVVVNYTPDNQEDQWGWAKPVEILESRDPVKVWDWLQRMFIKYSVG